METMWLRSHNVCLWCMQTWFILWSGLYSCKKIITPYILPSILGQWIECLTSSDKDEKLRGPALYAAHLLSHILLHYKSVVALQNGLTVEFYTACCTRRWHWQHARNHNDQGTGLHATFTKILEWLLSGTVFLIKVTFLRDERIKIKYLRVSTLPSRN